MPGILPMKMIRVGSSAQSRIAQACDRCRSKKIRCDGVRPTCTQCSNVGFECKTSDKLSRRAFPRGYTESLEDRVRGLEAEVRELKDLLDEKDEKIDMLSRIHNFAPSRKGSSCLSPTNAAQVKAEVQSVREEFIHVEIPAPVDPKSASTGSSTTPAFVEAFEQKLQESGRQAPDIAIPVLLPSYPTQRSTVTTASKLPPRILSDQYINLFFQEWQPMLPILHRPTFLRVYEHYLAGPESPSWHSNKQAIAQLFLIFEISSISSLSQNKQNLPSYENQWRKALYSSSSVRSVSSVQCHLLAQLCYLLRGNYAHLSRHRGIAIGMCYELGLHQGHKYHALSTLEAETGKKVFWCQYVLDKFTSAATGMPMMLRDADISTELPADIDDENITAQGFSPALPGELTKVSSALALIRVARILSKTFEHLYPTKASYQLSLSKLHALSDELDQWSEELPDHLRLRFCNDKPATNLISCRSPLLSLAYFYVRSLVHRPLLCHGSDSAAAAASIVLSAAGKHIIQILDLLHERRMNYTFPFNMTELMVTSGFSILWQSADLDEDSKLVKDNQKSLTLLLLMLARENQITAVEFQKVAAVFVALGSRRVLSPKHIEIDSPSARLLDPTAAPDVRTKSTRKQLQAIASRFSSFSNRPKIDDSSRRATVPQAKVGQSMSPPRAGSTVSLASTRSAPVMTRGTPSPHPMIQKRTSNGPPSINLDYFPFGEGLGDISTSASSSTMLPPRKQAPQQSPSMVDNASWEQLLTNIDNSSAGMYTGLSPAHGNLSSSNLNSGLNDWTNTDGWSLPNLDPSSKGHVPQSLLSFSEESMTSGDDFVFSTAGSNNGSLSTNESRDISSGGSTFKGITIPVDDEFDFHELEV